MISRTLTSSSKVCGPLQCGVSPPARRDLRNFLLAMRLPGTILQGILACAALTFLRICLGGVLVLQGWLGSQRYETGGLALLPWAELLLGSTLILGLLTRLSAAGALLMLLQRLFSQELQPGVIPPSELPVEPSGSTRC